MLERNFIASIKKSILMKEPLAQIEKNKPINEIFEVIYSMDEEIIVNYIRHFCYQYIDYAKNNSTTSLGNQVRLISNRVYPSIAPNSPYVSKTTELYRHHENAKKFIDKINSIGQEIRYEIFKGFIENRKPLKDLYGEIFDTVIVIDMVNKYMISNKDNFEEYVYYMLIDGLYERSLKNPKIGNVQVVNSVISKAIIGGTNLHAWDEGESIFSIAHEQYNKLCESLVSNCVKNNTPLRSIDRCLMTDQAVMEKFLEMNITTKQEFITKRMDYYLAQRRMMNFETFNTDCIWGVINSHYIIEKFKKERKEIREYIESLYDLYAKKLIEGNRDEINLNSDNWTIFFMEGPVVKYRTFKFDDIESEKFRYEIKLYMMDECTYRIKNNNTLSLIKKSVNFLYNRNKACDSFAKINIPAIQALNNYLQQDLYVKGAYNTKRKRSVATISKTVCKLGQIVEFLIKYGKKNTLRTLVPELNPFTITYKNLDGMAKRTDIIPDIILEQMDKHTIELNPIHQLMYEIFEVTGMRLSSVCKLEDNCLKPSRYENVMILKYKPYKIEYYNKKKGKLPYEEVIITQGLANKIQAQKEATKNLREKYNSQYIFLNIPKENQALRPNIISGNGFIKALNRIVQKYNIADYDGVLWHFTSRQFRKTLVSLMKENNATDSEIAYVLGHNTLKTLNRYYKEINEQRLENLNHEFFKKRFGIDIGEENLRQYSEEEKKCLYIDFVTNYRRVPLGYCSKPIASGKCDKQSGASVCEKCPRICTGKPFISEWIKLRDDRKRELNDLIEYYSKNNISTGEYSEYKEYKHILYEFKLYQEAIDKINEKCNEGEQ